MSRNNHITMLEQSAEQEFSHYDGLDELDGYDDITNEMSSFDETVKVKVDRLSSSDRVLTIKATNTDTSVQRCTFFGSFKNQHKPNFGNDSSVNLECTESDYRHILAEVAASPMLFIGLKVMVTNASQLSNTLTIKKSESTGRMESEPLQPSNFISAHQLNPTISEMPNIRFHVDGKSEIGFDLLPGTEATFIFTVAAKTDASQMLHGKSPVKM